MPALDRDAADVITGSEHILKAYAEKHSLTATAIVDLIKNVLKNPEFNADDVDTNMLQRLQAAIDSGDLQVINMDASSGKMNSSTVGRRQDAIYPFNIQGHRFRNKNPQVRKQYFFCPTYNIEYDIVYDIVYDIIYDVVYHPI